MKKLKSLLKAILSQDMNLFKYNVKNNKSKNKSRSFMLPLVLALIFMYAIGTYLNLLANELSKLNLTYILLTISLLVPTLFL